MSLNNRLAKVESITLDTAHALIERVYGVTAASLAAMKELMNLVREHHAIFQDHTIDDVMQGLLDSSRRVIEEHTADPDHDRYVDKYSTMLQRAGIDRQILQDAQRRLIMAWDLPEVITLDMMIDLEKQIYAACHNAGNEETE